MGYHRGTIEEVQFVGLEYLPSRAEKLGSSHNLGQSCLLGINERGSEQSLWTRMWKQKYLARSECFYGDLHTSRYLPVQSVITEIWQHLLDVFFVWLLKITGGTHSLIARQLHVFGL
jgi:hypothetical protein